MTKRIWAGLLALGMALTALPFGIYAEETVWEEETDASEETLDGGLDESAEEFADGLPDYIPEPETDVVDGAADDESADELSEQEESLIEEETTPDLPDFIPEEELPVLDEEEPQDVQAGDFVRVTPNTRVYLEIDETAGDDDDGELYDGNFVNEANVYVEQARQDAQGRTWLLVRYLYGAEEPNGEMAWTDTATVWVLAEETQPSDAADYDVTDYAFPFTPVELYAASDFNLRDHNAGVQTFYPGQQNLYGSSGHDSEYKQIAKLDGYGTIYATPHYLEGQTVYCLEHTMNSPGTKNNASGPFEVVDLDGYAVKPGYSGDIYGSRTMHAIGWVLRHTYPYMIVDTGYADSDVWSRVAGQFAIREVVKQLEGDWYVRDYWQMDEFYRASGQAPGDYLEYARWLADCAIERAGITGEIGISSKSVSMQNGSYVGTVTLTTDADLIRISRSVGNLTGNSAGSDGEYYYLRSGDTISVTSTQSTFSIAAQSVSSQDEEAAFLIGIPNADIQKVIIPQEGEPYPLASTSVSFEVPHGSVSVTKKDADSGAALSGAVFELLSGSSILQTVTTGANGTATFSNVQPGSYTVREVSAPEGYRLAATSTQNVSVSIGQTASVTFTNEQKEGKIRIVKTDQLTGRPLAGAEFTITRLSAPPAAGNTGVGESVVITTDANGHAETGWLPYGRYRVEETGVPENYVDNRLSTTVDAYKDGQTYTVEVQNEPLKGYISLTKTDRLDGQPIAGVQFDIFHNDEYGEGLAGTMTTNANGVATSPPLRMGSYIVREHGAPSGYITELVELEAAVEPDETTELTATNQPIQGYIRIVKSDDLTGAVLADAEFTITRVSGLPSHNGSDDGEVVAAITTDENGVATSPLLTWGTYRVEETGVPEHYVDKQFSVDVSIPEHMQTYQVVVENEPTKGTIRLTKTDRLDGQPIAGVQFDIYHNDEYGTGAAGTMTTDANGVAISPPLRKGSYIIREHADPTGYVSELVEMEALVYSDETTDLAATNQPIQGYIRIVKSDELTGEALAGAAFTITRVSGLPSHNGSNDGEVVAVMTTDANGVAVSPLLTWGTYRVTETGVPVHYVDNSFSIDVNVSEHMNTYEVAVENEPTKGWIRLVKTDRLNGNPIAGIQFDIYYNDQYGEGLAATMTTDANGIAVSEPLRKGQYLIREHGATAGYYFEETMLQATVRSDETTELAVTNQPVMVQLNLYKRDKDEYTGNPADAPTVRGDGLLTGAEFQVMAAENIVDRQGNIIHSKGDVVIESIHTNGADASVNTVELWPGLYEFIELTPPTGYQTSSQRVQIDASGAAQQSEVAVITYEGVITNEIRYGAQAIVKILGENSLESDPTRVETPEEGAEFAVYLKKAGSYAEARDFERDYLVTDERGYAMTKALPYGVYVLQQTAGEEGYEIKGPIVFEINGTESLINPPPLALNDKPILYRLCFIKVDSETGNPITLSNASFKLKDADGQYVTQTVYYPREMELDTFTTDDTGSVTLPETVGWGLYSIEEVTAPDGYLLSDEEIEIFVGNSGDTPGSIYELEIEIPNDPVKGRIQRLRGGYDR